MWLVLSALCLCFRDFPDASMWHLPCDNDWKEEAFILAWWGAFQSCRQRHNKIQQLKAGQIQP